MLLLPLETMSSARACVIGNSELMLTAFERLKLDGVLTTPLTPGCIVKFGRGHVEGVLSLQISCVSTLLSLAVGAGVRLLLEWPSSMSESLEGGSCSSKGLVPPADVEQEMSLDC